MIKALRIVRGRRGWETDVTGVRRRSTVMATAVGLAVAAVLSIGAVPTAAFPDDPGTAAVDGTCEGELRRLHDQARAGAGLPALREDPAFDQVARGWAMSMARSGRLAHNPDHVARIRAVVPDARRIAENVGTAPGAARMHAAFMASPGHRANILDGGVQRIAVGCVRAPNGQMWATVNFVGAVSALPDRRPTPFRSAGDASSRLRWWLLAAGPNPTQVEADAGRLLASWTAADLAAYLAGSSVHAGLVPGTTRLYGAAFDRPPDADGLTFWIRRRQAGQSLNHMAASFVASAEFRRTYGALDDTEFVTQVYRNVLDREPDAEGLAHWVGRLRAGATRGQVLVGFSESAENKRITVAAVTVSWAFVQMIGRVPTDVERLRWETSVANGMTTADGLVRWLASTAAFTQRVGTGDY